MLPLKKYTFECIDNPNIKITIEAHNIVEAYELIVITAKHPKDFKLVE